MKKLSDLEIKKERGSSYGSVESSFGRISILWSAYTGTPIKPHQVAVMMTLLKVSRMTTAKDEVLLDCYQDARVYLDLAEELDCKNG